MRIRSLLNPAQLHTLVQQYHMNFSESEQKFLINMLVACDLNQTITEKQWAWLSSLIRRVEIIAQLKNT
jgi:hypothetical protein